MADAVSDLLADLNGDFILVLFPLDIRPIKPAPGAAGDLHKLRAGAPPGEAGGIEIDRSRLPQGEVRLDTFKIDFAC